MWWDNWWFIIYVVVGSVWAVLALFQWADCEMDDLEERQFAARGVLIAPIWPLVVLYGVGRLLGVLFMDAVRSIEK